MPTNNMFWRAKHTLKHGHTRPRDVVRLPAMDKCGGIGDHRATLNEVS